MVHEIDKGQDKKTRGRARELLSIYRSEDPGLAKRKRDQFLILLKSRYSYTNEKSVDELVRLLKQFYKINRSLGIHRGRPDL